MITNRHIQRVVAWADILHASVRSLLPTLGTAQYDGKKPSAQRILASRRSSPLIVPTYFQSILGDLQDLADMRSFLINQPSSRHQNLRVIFSDLLFLTEYSILEMGRSVTTPKPPIKISEGEEAIKAAALMFTFQNFRDMAITATFFDPLLQRLREGLSVTYGDTFSEWHSTHPHNGMAAVALPLWLCLNGWKACAVTFRQSEQAFFVEMAANFCKNVKIESSERFISCLSQIVFSTMDRSSHCINFWTDVKEWTAACEAGEMISC